ncbi:MAG: hypothetical protein U9O66_00145 [Patescibacteria group bacterium]|nr:hypothetical protein [Patescibacteria group bacterium]
MFDETKNQTDESQQAQNPTPPKNPQNFNERMENLNQNGNKSGKRKKIYSIIGIGLITIFIISILFVAYSVWDDLVSMIDFGFGPEMGDDMYVKVNCPPSDLKKCADGSFVWRTLPDCEFAECPAVEIKKNCAKEGETIDAQVICCNGLKAIGGWPGGYEGDCSLPAPPTGLKICSNCGDGNCNINTGENRCNCPEDCGKKIDTSNWQTYRNEKYGFEINYPTDWTDYWRVMSEEGIKNSYEVTSDVHVLNYYSIINEKKEIGVNIVILNNPSGKSLNDCDWVDQIDWIDESIINNTELNTSKIKLKIPKINFQIDNIEAIKQGGYSELTNMSIMNVVINFSPKKIIFFEFMANKHSEECFNIFEQILSSFKLLQDTDSDGLFDDEEAEYGCDINNPDTDGDGFLDGDEVKNGYNPNGEGKLLKKTDTPENTLNFLEKARSECNANSYISKIYFPKDLPEHIKSIIGKDTSMEAIILNSKIKASSYVPINEIDRIDIIDKKIIDNNHVKLNYAINYLPDENGNTIVSQKDEKHFIKINDEWLLDIESKFNDEATVEFQMKKARHSKRISDIGIIQTAIEIYYTHNNSYPEFLSDLPLNISNPKPNDGNCAEDAEYDYSTKDKGQSYELIYCLGEDAGRTPAGYNTATPNGITNRKMPKILYKQCNLNE